MSEDARTLARLRWRSRRGMRELDALLTRYLDQCWHAAAIDERDSFERLLACEDTVLWPWLSGREQPEDESLNALVQHIRSLPVRP
jgi:antitoxin CptB